MKWTWWFTIANQQAVASELVIIFICYSVRFTLKVLFFSLLRCMAFLLHGGSLYAVCSYLYLLVFFETLQSKNYHNMLFSSDFDWRAHVLFKWQANWKYGTEVFLLWSYMIIWISLAAGGLSLKEMSFITAANLKSSFPETGLNRDFWLNKIVRNLYIYT